MIDHGQSAELPSIPIVVSAKLPDGTEFKIVRYLPAGSSLELQGAQEQELKWMMESLLLLLPGA